MPEWTYIGSSIQNIEYVISILTDGDRQPCSDSGITGVFKTTLPSFHRVTVVVTVRGDWVLERSCLQLKVMTSSLDSGSSFDVPKTCQLAEVIEFGMVEQSLMFDCICDATLCNEVKIWIPESIDSLQICEIAIHEV